jgi:hypothetical protein
MIVPLVSGDQYECARRYHVLVIVCSHYPLSISEIEDLVGVMGMNNASMPEEKSAEKTQ